jgi:hypothetical protein
MHGRAAREACDQPLKTFYFVSGAHITVIAAFHLLMKRVVFRCALYLDYLMLSRNWYMLSDNPNCRGYTQLNTQYIVAFAIKGGYRTALFIRYLKIRLKHRSK